MASCHDIGDGDWYAISLITLVEPRLAFQNVARFLAMAMANLFGARLHWGKWFPLDAEEVDRSYPGMREFRAACEEFDPVGVFRNRFLAETMFRTPDHHDS